METKLDPIIKAKWTEALRSGKYAQGRYQLRNHKDEYCCLGVLCDISRRGQWDGMRYSLPGSGGFGEYSADGSVPDKLKEEIGLSVSQAIHLISLNDYEHKTFVEIANYIEDYL